MHSRPRESRAPLGLNMANIGEGHLRDFSSFSPMCWSSHFMEQPWRLVGVQLKKACLECGRGRMLDVPARSAGFNVLVGRHGRAGQTQGNPEQTHSSFSRKLCNLAPTASNLNKMHAILPKKATRMALMCWQRATVLVWICAGKWKPNRLDFPGQTTQNRSPLPTH